MPPDSAPRLRVVLSDAQQGARVRSLALGAGVGAALAVVLVVAAINVDGAFAWVALVAAMLPATVAVLAARTALVLGRLRAAPTRSDRVRQLRGRPGASLPVNLGRAEAEAAAPSDVAPTERP